MKTCKVCNVEMDKYQYVNAGDYSQELLKEKNGQTIINVTNWIFICPICKRREIIPMSKKELELIQTFLAEHTKK